MGRPTRPRASPRFTPRSKNGITLLDTGDFYGMGHNEILLRNALRGVPRDGYLLSVKFGAQRGPDRSWLGYDARPAAVKTALAYSLQRLDVDYIDVYRPARLDLNVPIEETVGAIAEMVKAGYVRYIGLSEVGAATVRRAHAVHPIVDLQIEYSLISRSVERAILPTLRELGIAVTAYGVLSRGNDIIPLIGARRRDRLAEALGALEASFGKSDLARIDQAVPADAAKGDRYDAHAMTSSTASEADRDLAYVAVKAHDGRGSAVRPID